MGGLGGGEVGQQSEDKSSSLWKKVRMSFLDFWTQILDVVDKFMTSQHMTKLELGRQVL